MKHLSKCSQSKGRFSLLFVAGIAGVLTALFVGIMLGSTAVTPAHILNALKSGAVGTQERIFLYVRLPRTLGCLLTGAALSVSGAVIQNVLANRLASPSIIGVNSGAGLAVTLCTVFGIYGGWRLSLFAFLGAVATVTAVSLFARRFQASRSTVILIGVALNSFLNAVSDAVITLRPDIGMMNSDFKIGDFSAVTYQKLYPAAAIICLTLILLITLSNELDVLTLGDENARGLGLNTNVFRVIFLILAALLAGCAVSLAGLLSFVGLLVPHALRRLGANRAGQLIPLCALFGAGFVSLCDTAARTVFAPYEIPVGIIMAFVGVPFFIFILVKSKGGHARDRA